MNFLAGILLAAGAVSLWVIGLIYPAWLKEKQPDLPEKKLYTTRGAGVVVAIICFLMAVWIL
ncbi:hypothetical protein [Alteribacter natronophilus]|uniref:hypothetical protein n=1 Tax=Alteribacter natronophilus TaxID=2583810 RepID=UPI00110E4C80|nr:hypothetical protein [Alteribacter natronophilus]TMW70098.1 hypothetical protein FGB90_18175 [Alteribacter natronophilus]